MINWIHYGVEGDDHLDSWIREGLAEYDGYFHTTEWNRTEAVYRLFDRSEKRNLPAAIYCCRTLRRTSAAMGTTDVYYGGAIVMIFLAESFGEQIHAELFAAPMADLMLARGTTVDEAFTRFQAWYIDKLEEIEDKRKTPGADYAPNVACTGRYWYRDDGKVSFEVRILNNDRRPESHVAFRQQYRSDASTPWTTASGQALIPVDSSTSGFSTPLFTGISSPPFQWRARACPRQRQSDVVCSNWSNIINWTAASCASTRVGAGPVFTDDPLVAGSTPVRAIHFRELRQSIGNLRARAGLPPMQWTDPTLRAGVTLVKSVHLTELRAALDAVHDAVGRARPSYTDATVTTQGAAIKAVHVMELRDAVAALAAARARSLPYSTERDATDGYPPPAGEDVEARATESQDPTKELHDRGDLHEARIPLQ